MTDWPMPARVLLLAFVAFASAALAAALPTTFDPTRDAEKDVALALQIAKREGKRVLVDVGGEWCAWCKIMDRFFAANAAVRTVRDTHYVWVKVNWSKENRNEALLSRWPKIDGYPHLFVLDADGRVLHSQDTSLLEHGRTYDLAKFTAFLERWRGQKATMADDNGVNRGVLSLQG